jgi:hypothetical protein
LFTINWNSCSRSLGIAVHDPLESGFTIEWNMQIVKHLAHVINAPLYKGPPAAS